MDDKHDGRRTQTCITPTGIGEGRYGASVCALQLSTGDLQIEKVTKIMMANGTALPLECLQTRRVLTRLTP